MSEQCGQISDEVTSIAWVIAQESNEAFKSYQEAKLELETCKAFAHKGIEGILVTKNDMTNAEQNCNNTKKNFELLTSMVIKVMLDKNSPFILASSDVLTSES